MLARVAGSQVVTAAEVSLEECVKDDEEVPAPISCIDSFEVPTFRLRHVIGTIRELAAHDRLQGKLDREVEVIGEERLHRVDHFAAIRLESVRRVVVAVAEEQADEAVRQPVDDELDAWIVVDGAAAHERDPKAQS